MSDAEKPKSPLKEMSQPFIDLIHAPRALWGINLAYVIEGMVYFGMLGYLAMHFSDFIFQGVEHADEYSHNMVMVLTAGITIAMLLLGFVPDKLGVRFALIAAFAFMLVGRAFMSGAPNLLGFEPTRPGVFVGDKVSLHVTKVDTRDKNKAITKAAVIANDEGGANVDRTLTLDLAAGEGMVPTNGLESRLVKLSEAKVIEGEENTWKVEYGSAPVTARLLMHSAEELGIHAGATISLTRAYVAKRKNKKTKEDEFIIRSHWLEDVAAIDTFPLDLSAGDGIEPHTSLESCFVQLSEAKLVEGDGEEWQVQYGRGPVTARLLIDSTEEPPLCAGAIISLHRAFVVKQEKKEGDQFVIQVHWPDDVAAVNTSGCLEQRDRTKAIGDELVLDLAAGEGIAPDATLETKPVQLGKARLVEGEGQEWLVQYGSGLVTARLLIDSAEESGLGAGATISLRRADVIRRDEEGTEFIIRAHWPEDVAAVNTFGCEEGPYRTMVTAREKVLRSDSRWPIAEETQEVRDATPVTIAELRDMKDGPVNVVLRDACVSYVRNGGYFLQSERDGPAIFAFINPVWSTVHLATMLGIVLVVIGYGMYQPSAYAGVRQFTTPKTAAMGFAMLYALMNLGAWLPTFAFLLRDEHFLDLGIPGTYWVYTGFTLIALLGTIVILTRKTIANAIARAKEETAAIKAAEPESEQKEKPAESEPTEPTAASPILAEKRAWVPIHMWVLVVLAIAGVHWRVSSPWDLYASAGVAVTWVFLALFPPTARWLIEHPLADAKFFFFIFALIPVQTLFTYNWLILPQYISRAFEGWIGEYFEITANANPLLIFIFVPIIAAATQKRKVYNMMIYGTFVMAAPAFLPAIGPYWWTLFPYLLIMTIGEAMWQPRFLQYAAEIAPAGRTGVYIGVAQLPWFLTKVLVPWLYSGWMMDRYCPAEGEQNTKLMWFIFGCIAMCSTVMLVLAKRWVGKDFKTKAD